MQKTKLLILVAAFTFVFVNLASAQVKDTVLKPADTAKIKLSKSKLDTTAKKPMTRRDSVKAKYVNPGKVAGRKAVFRSMIIPGWGQLYNIQILNDGYGTRAGKSQVFQKLYTGGKIAAIYGGATALTLSLIDSRKNYKRFLTEAQYRENNPGKKSDLTQYSDQGVLDGKSLYKRNSQIVYFSYGLLYAANIIDAYVAARLHFFNIDDNLSFRVMPSMINTDSMYGLNLTPALKLSLTF
ncbi:MAG: hypothetical protein J7577_11720 [Sphingobacteriaceae bacterium]|nr:hypothetical protein [Sphingobacteriaceae bacterium]